VGVGGVLISEELCIFVRCFSFIFARGSRCITAIAPRFFFFHRGSTYHGRLANSNSFSLLTLDKPPEVEEQLLGDFEQN